MSRSSFALVILFGGLDKSHRVAIYYNTRGLHTHTHSTLKTCFCTLLQIQLMRQKPIFFLKYKGVRVSRIYLYILNGRGIFLTLGKQIKRIVRSFSDE